MSRRLLGAIAALGLVAFVLATWALGQRSGAPAPLGGRLVAHGPVAPVEILRDARGVPHVRAQDARDAYFGLGFAHAQDRLSQMRDMRDAAAGRLAEREGASALPADRLARLLGIASHAEAQSGLLDSRTRGRLEAYASGVNAFLEQRADAEPAIDAWRPADSLALVKLFAWGLGGSLDVSLTLADLIERVGATRARLFFPGAETTSQAGGAPIAQDDTRYAWRDPLRARLGLDGSSVGSSAWIVSGRRSASGKPLLAADSHFEVTAPPVFYEAHLMGGALDVAGATLPGVPVFWTGHNRRVAWAATHARAVTTDLFVETLDSDRARYHDGRAWRPLRARSEEMVVRGGDVETLAVHETRRGPLVAPLLDRPREPLSLCWTGARPGDGVTSLLRAAEATSAEAFRERLGDHHEPVLAFVFVDDQGKGGLQMAGWLPRRALASGLVPISGRAGWSEWQGRVPFRELPSARLGRRTPWLVAADGPLPGAAQSAAVEWLWRSGERARRIDALLGEAAEREPIDLRELAVLQSDVHSTGARELVAAALALVPDAGATQGPERDVLELLRGWDGRADASSPGAAVYHAFHVALLQDLLLEGLGDELAERLLGLSRATPTRWLGRIVSAAAQDDGSADWSRAEVAAGVRRALRATGLRFGVEIGPNRDRWAWGRLHVLRFRPFGRARSGTWLEALGSHAYPGDGASIAAGAYSPGEDFTVRVASTYRFAVDTAELDKAFSALAPGQGEAPRHPHRADQLDDWLAGRNGLLLTSDLLVEEGATARLRIEPAP